MNMTSGRNNKIKLLLVIIMASMLSTGFKECGWLSTEEIEETPFDRCPVWDTDCDDISNAVETNNANAYLGLHPDTINSNPTVAEGTPTNGSIHDALNLVDQEAGYYHFYGIDPVDTDDWGVLAMINMIEGAGRDWLASGSTPPRMGVGDISWGNSATQIFGGQFGDHDSHQNGLDVDIRYVRNDGQEASLNIASAPDDYSPVATAKLMNYLLYHGNVALIYVDTFNIRMTGSILRHWPGHSNHFHVRIIDPDGTWNKDR